MLAENSVFASGRVEIVQALDALNDERLPQAMKLALADQDARVRNAGRSVMAKRQPREAVAALRDALDTPIATGEMLSSATDLRRLLEADAVDVIQPDAVRIGGITPYRRVSDLADELGVTVAPHFATQLHVHLAAGQPREGWVEWFDWLDPLFEERVELRDGKVVVPDRPGLGLTVSPRAGEWLLSAADLPES